MSNPLLDTSSLPRFMEISPEHVMPALTELIAAHRQKLDQLLMATPEPDFDSLVAPLEEMGHELARVWSPVSHLQGVLGSGAWRDAYNSALPLLTEHGTELAQNVPLQQAYAAVGKALDATAGPAKRSVVDQALRDFRLAGVDLPDAAKSRFRQIMQQLAATQAAFEHNVQDASDAWSLHIADEKELAGLAPQIIERAAAEARKRDRQGMLLTLDYPTYDAIMRQADNRRLREAMYRAWVTRGSEHGEHPQWDNSANIELILALRHEAAQLVGFRNYADYSLATKMAQSTAEVLEFLRELASRSRAAAEKELSNLSEFAGRTLAPWDIAYSLEKFKQKKHSISNEELRRYFPAQKTVAGLFKLAERLYGVRLEAQDNVARWHEDVRYYRVRDEAGALIGGFYTDLHARTGKRTGAWVDECVGRKNLNGQPTLPVGYLVCNFPPLDDRGRSLLTHDDVVTLFHEFGHMLHQLLTRVDYPSISGINGVPWDAVELPSQFMENFAWNFEVLEMCSGHVDSGKPLERELFDKLEGSRNVGAGLAMLRQLEFALFDFRLHAEYDLAKGSRVLQILAEVREEVSLLQPPDYNRMPHSFTHIFAGGYAAGYYSYKWAEVLAADAFGAFEEAGIFDQATAKRFRSEILEIGGSRDIMQAYIAFRGRKPKIDALLAHNGII
ncbi:MAG: M3 family metallopeptidase [Gammaproteobacteria bacterium]|nr:M3 family metallopeptidase [Gammaproteobacteria bacterium]MDH5321963.1 M3 family metallopeptidase [Gammaproteobacteria bacterium]